MGKIHSPDSPQDADRVPQEADRVPQDADRVQVPATYPSNYRSTSDLDITSTTRREVLEEPLSSPLPDHGQSEAGDYQSFIEESNESQNEHSSTPITNITIFIVGRSGSGVSSTIRELIGPNTNCQMPDGKETVKDFMEYTLKIPSPSAENPDYNIKLVDVPGFVDGRTMEMDAQIIASMKSYTYQNGFPDYYLALSRFDDNRMDGEHSLFVQFLKRLELFQETSGRVSSENIVFLMTRLMSVDRAMQRRPQTKINVFKGIIETYTSFVPPITMIVGENLGHDYEFKIEGGYYKLPNKQHYPKNIWEALTNVTSPDDPKGLARQQILTAMMNNRESINVTCEAHLFSTEWDYYDDDAYDFQYFLEHKNITAQDNEVNAKIQQEFNKLSPRMKDQRSVQKLALQLRFQNMNITTMNDLPATQSQQARLFQSNRFSSGVSAILLAEAFGMRMPEYIKSLHVGYGYDLVKDELLSQSPFRSVALRPSNVGYELPNFLKCRKFFQPSINYYTSYSQNMADYTTERFKYLDFAGKENMTDYKLDLKLKEGFNLKPDDNDNVITLSSVQEIRTLKCTIDRENLHLLLNQDILVAVNSMTKFNPAKRDSVNEWVNFFDTFGSHIVTESYGGGSMHGSLVGSSLRNVLVSESSVDSVLNSIVRFTKFSEPDTGSPSYRFYGGSPDAQMDKLYDLPVDTRKALLNAWTETLNSDFVMLKTELALEPLSNFVKPYNQEKGEFVETAIEFLLRGNLKYARIRNRTRTTKPPKQLTTKKPSGTSQSANPTQNPIGEQPSNSNERPGTNIHPVPYPVSPTGYSPETNINIPSFTGFPSGGNNPIDLEGVNLPEGTSTIDLYSQSIANQAKENQARYEAQLAAEQRQREEQRRLAAEQTQRMMETMRLRTENQGIRYKQMIEDMTRQTQNQQLEYDANIQAVRIQNEEEQKRHDTNIRTIKRQRCKTLRDEYTKCKSSLVIRSESYCMNKELRACKV
ncbi:unnamed protein product [Orchesella dallaii]|uniref:MACPF domain-containing protein n=1 Tax=Orchesella dallaii TaxID=48710 RepID=A0ABP1QNS0_9HEXA